jgi:Dullard-like phosphatase family protein
MLDSDPWCFVLCALGQLPSTHLPRWFSLQRPHLHSFLEEVHALGQLVIFTSATEEYALKLAGLLDPSGDRFMRVLSRSSCLEVQRGVYVKDLKQCGRSLARTVLIDDTKTSFLLQPDNGLPISPFFGDHRDAALPGLLPALQHLATLPDVSRTMHA